MGITEQLARRERPLEMTPLLTSELLDQISERRDLRFDGLRICHRASEGDPAHDTTVMLHFAIFLARDARPAEATAVFRRLVAKQLANSVALHYLASDI